MSTETTVYIGPYVELTTKRSDQIRDLLEDAESLLDVSGYITGSQEGVRIIVPNQGRGAPRQFWLNPDDWAAHPFRFDHEDAIHAEVAFLAKAFEPELKKLARSFAGEEESVYVRWGFFVWEM